MKRLLPLAFVAAVLAPVLVWAAGETVATFGISSGTNPRNVCVYDLSVSRPCVPIGSLDSTLHVFTPVSATIAPSVPGGRLTLTSGVPVLTSDVTAATTVYYTPYYGNGITVFNGTALISYTFNEISQALDSNAGHTNYQAANNNFDEFVIVDGTTLRLCTGPAWTSATARGTGAGTTELEYHLGFLANKNTLVCRWGALSGSTVSVPADEATYVGSMRATADGTTAMVMDPAAASGGATATIGIWNNYNQVAVQATNTDNGTSYTYASASWREARNSTTNNILFLQGQYTSTGVAFWRMKAATGATLSNACSNGVGLDVTNADFKQVSGYDETNAAVAQPARILVTVLLPPQLGWHALNGMEYANSGTCTYNGGDPSILELQVND